MDKIVSDISSSEDELLTGEHIENNYSPIDGDFKSNTKLERDDDQMSLSSLSSTEQKIEESKIDIVQQQQQPPPPPMPPGHFNPYQQYSGISSKIKLMRVSITSNIVLFKVIPEDRMLIQIRDTRHQLIGDIRTLMDHHTCIIRIRNINIFQR